MRMMRVIGSVFIVLLSVCMMTQAAEPAEAYSSVDTAIPVSCLPVERDTAHTYTIKIDRVSKDAPKPKEDTLQILEDGTGAFEISITEPGTFLYKIYEKDGGNSRIRYDATVYNVTVYVETASDDALRYAVSVTDEKTGLKPDKVEFANIVLGDQDVVTTAASEVIDDQTQDRQTTTAVTTTLPDFSDVIDRQTTDPESTSTETVTETVTDQDSAEDPTETEPAETAPSEPIGSETLFTRMTFETITATERVSEDHPTTVTEYLTSVLTGDRTPLGLLLGGLGAAGFIGGIAVLLRKRDE